MEPYPPQSTGDEQVDAVLARLPATDDDLLAAVATYAAIEADLAAVLDASTADPHGAR